MENHLALGASFAISESLKMHAAYELALSNKQTATSKSLIAEGYNISYSRLSENTFNLSLSWILN